MKNVYDIRKEQNLNFILDAKYGIADDEKIRPGEMAVIIHLHYLESIEYYFSYIKYIPEEVDVYFSVSNDDTKKMIQSCSAKYHVKNYMIIEKNNRGRDVSALLVACRTIILQYEYVCFLHDKKAKTELLEQDIKKWIFNMWGNLLGKQGYLYSIKKIFESNSTLGLLVPPEPMGDYICAMYGDSWEKDFECAMELIEKLSLKCDLQKSIPPISFGTAFWCKVDALKKIFEINWEYEDFPEEPMPNDGTISHAIERIFPYVAQDAGYTTGCIMTKEYAGIQKEDMQCIMQAAFKYLRENFEMYCLADIVQLNINKKKVISFFDCYEEIYLYGAGKIGRVCLDALCSEGREPKGILVSECADNVSALKGIPVLKFSEKYVSEKVGIIVTVGYKLRNEVVDTLKKFGATQYMIWSQSLEI